MLKSTATRIMFYVVMAWFVSADYSLASHYGHLNGAYAALVAGVGAIVSPTVLVGVMHARKTPFKLILEPAAMMVVVAAYLGFYSKFNAWESLVAGSIAMGGFLVALAEERQKTREAVKEAQANLEYNRVLAYKEITKANGQELTNVELAAAKFDTSLDSHPIVVEYLARTAKQSS